MGLTTEQAHKQLENVLLNGRILVNGLPLTANEISSLLMGEKMLFSKATRLDQQTEAKKEPEKKE